MNSYQTFYSNKKPLFTPSSKIMMKKTKLEKLKLRFSSLRRKLASSQDDYSTNEYIRPIHSSIRIKSKKRVKTRARASSQWNNSVMLPKRHRSKKMSLVNIGVKIKPNSAIKDSRNFKINMIPMQKPNTSTSLYNSSTDCSNMNTRCVLNKYTNSYKGLPKLAGIQTAKKIKKSDDYFDAISDNSPASSPSPKMAPKFIINLKHC